MAKDEIPQANQDAILKASGRVCALCYKWERDLSVKRQGQIAHVKRKREGEPRDHAVKNLCWLCLAHHDLYDSETRLSKGIRPAELIECRDKVHELVKREEAPLPYAGPRAVLELEIDVAELWPYFTSKSLREGRLNEPDRHLFLFLVTVCNLGHAWTGIRSAALKHEGQEMGNLIPVTLDHEEQNRHDGSTQVEGRNSNRYLRSIRQNGNYFQKPAWRSSARGLTLAQDQGVGPGQMATWVLGFQTEARPEMFGLGSIWNMSEHEHKLASPWLLELVPVAGAPAAVEVLKFDVRPD